MGAEPRVARRVGWSLLIVWVGASACGADPAPGGPTLDELGYVLPKAFAAVPEASDARALVAAHERYANALFLAPLATPADRDAMLDRLIPRLAAVLLPDEPVPTRWRPVESPQLFPAETGHERRLGFNGRSLFHIQIRQLEHKGQPFLTGYAWATSDLEVDGSPAGAFRAYRGGDSVPAGEGSADLIESIFRAPVQDTYNPPPMPPMPESGG